MAENLIQWKCYTCGELFRELELSREHAIKYAAHDVASSQRLQDCSSCDSKSRRIAELEAALRDVLRGGDVAHDETLGDAIRRAYRLLNPPVASSASQSPATEGAE